MQSTAPAQFATTTGAGGAYTAYKRTPARPPSLAADVITPIGKGAAVGLAFATLAIVPAALVEGWPWYTPIFTALGAAPIATIGFIFHHQSHLWNYEEYTQEGQPEPLQGPPSPPVALEVTTRTERGTFERMFRFELPDGVTEAAFYELAKGITEGGRGLSLTDWTGSRRPFSRAKFNQLLSALTDAGIIALVNAEHPSQGRRLTTKGRQSLLGYVATYEAK